MIGLLRLFLGDFGVAIQVEEPASKPSQSLAEAERLCGCSTGALRSFACMGRNSAAVRRAGSIIVRVTSKLRTREKAEYVRLTAFATVGPDVVRWSERASLCDSTTNSLVKLNAGDAA